MPPKFVRQHDNMDSNRARSAETRALLDGNSDEEDFFLKGPNVKPGNIRSDPKINRLQGQVNEVIDVMQNNVAKIVDRGDKLEDLQDKSENLSDHADMFRSRAKGLHRQMWWKNCKMKIIIAVVILILLAVIIIPIIVKSSQN
ncbi:vesicle-associated membrane protein 4-like [Mytilus galloprovincialis]|uniref:Vesicle-associated membrane protein 4 n=2 Tax=Mytilus TaxID=6548 RepID=A0A8B6FD66_MYTGA|nr:vesicle-associated membrane protein 4 [Mytilus galloprovincialis]